MWPRTGDFVFVLLFLSLLFLYCQQGISQSFGLKSGWNPGCKSEAPLIHLSFYLGSAALVCSFRWIREPTQPRGLLSKLCTRHGVCFNSFRMWRICGSRMLIAGYLGGGGGGSSVLFIAQKANVWGTTSMGNQVRWGGQFLSNLVFFFKSP